MSTLSGRPSNPTDSSANASHDPTEQESPYAPKHARRRTDTGQDLSASDATPLAPAGVPESEWPYSDARDEQPSPPTAFGDDAVQHALGADTDFGTPSLQPG